MYQESADCMPLYSSNPKHIFFLNRLFTSDHHQGACIKSAISCAEHWPRSTMPKRCLGLYNAKNFHGFHNGKIHWLQCETYTLTPCRSIGEGIDVCFTKPCKGRITIWITCSTYTAYTMFHHCSPCILSICPVRRNITTNKKTPAASRWVRKAPSALLFSRKKPSCNPSRNSCGSKMPRGTGRFWGIPNRIDGCLSPKFGDVQES